MKRLISGLIIVAAAMAVQAQGFFGTEKARQDNDGTTCRVEIRYSPIDPTGVAVDTGERNPATRCNSYMDRIAIAAASLRLVVERR